MNRKRTLIAVGIVVTLAILAAGAALSLRYEPTFYQAALAESAPSEARRERADAFVRTTLRLVDGIRNEERWSHEFSEEAVNSWLAEELPVKYAQWLPPEVTAPRIRFEKGTVLLAFQARHGMWQGVVSGRVRPLLAGPNQLALEIQSARIGLVPVPVDEVLGDFVDKLNGAGWRIKWTSTGKQDVLVVDLDDDPSPGAAERPILESVELGPKHLRIAGRRTSATDATRIADKP